MATMDDLIALAGQLHMSQEALDLNSFKAQLARTLVLPMPIPSSTGSSPASASDAPLPSPSTACGSFDAYPFQAPPQQGSPTPQPYQEDDAALAAAFAGDAFAPMLQQKKDPWAAFQPSFQPTFQQPPPQYQQQPNQQQQDAMDADMAEAML